MTTLGAAFVVFAGVLMLDLEPEIDEEYQRVLREVSGFPECVQEYSLSLSDVLKAHFLVANHFYQEGSGLGGVGPKDIGLLHSAIHRQSASFANERKWTDVFDVCATLMFGLIKNHPFFDANKRTAFLSALFQLNKNGRCPSVSEQQFEDFTVEIADNQLGKYKRFKEMQNKGIPDPEVKFISWFLRKNTREIDKKTYTVTFRELNVLLGKHNFALLNPSGNYINIVQRHKTKAVLGLWGKEKVVETTVGQIGFPRWTEEVGKGALKTVREVTKLTPEHGVDSASFFRGVDDMQTLITTYREPLRRLAQR